MHRFASLLHVYKNVFVYVWSHTCACWQWHGNCLPGILLANILILFSLTIFSLSSYHFLPAFFLSPLLLLPPSLLASLFHMLTVWLGICWPPGSLNQSRASLTESPHTCPDRNDNDCGQSPLLCPVTTVIRLVFFFWMPTVACEERGCIQISVWTQNQFEKETFHLISHVSKFITFFLTELQV